MAVELTSEESSLVTSQSKKESDLPSYFNATLNKFITISRDFESFLILLDDTNRQATIQWLSDARQLQVEQTDRDDLVMSAIDFELFDAQQKYEEIAGQIQEFDNFKAKFQASKFAGVVEVGQLLTDLQRPIDELASRRDRAIHSATVATFLQDNYENVTEAQQKQIDSWNESLTAY